MISITEFKDHLEKNAGAVGKSVKFLWDHPKSTLAAVLATGGAISLAKHIHPLHQMFREETKNIGMKKQRKILTEILNEQRKRNNIGMKNQQNILTKILNEQRKKDNPLSKKPKQKLIIPPLT